MNANRLALLFLCFFFVLSSCHQQTEEDRVKKVITTVQKAAEEKDVKEILSHLSKTYRDPQGNDYDGVKGLLLLYFYRHQQISIFIPDLAVSVTDSSGAAKFQAVLTGRNKGAGNILPESLGVYVFDVTFVKDAEEWKIASAKWERLADSMPASSGQ